MRRSVDQLASDRSSVSGRAVLRGLALAGLLAVRASAGDGDLPELTPPGDAPIVSKPSTPPTTTPPARKPAASGGRAVLALPGLTTPPSRPSTPPEVARPAPEAGGGELSLDAPIEMKPQAGSPIAGPSRASRPLVLEPSPMEESDAPGTGGGNRLNAPARRSTTAPPPSPAPARRPRLFGLLPGQAAPAPSVAPRVSTPGRSVAEGLRDDPASESALKRRIERQAREVVGNRGRAVEVKLAGKEALVQVSGVKFLQKRAVRKQLEGIPALAGLRSTIEVLD